MKVLFIAFFIILLAFLLVLLSYILGKIRKYIHIHMSIKSPLISTSVEIEASDKK